MDGDELDAVGGAIRHYLAGHPSASDTVEGVRLWWLAGEGTQAPARMVAAALERLVEEGAVRERRLAAGTTVYSARIPARGAGVRGASHTRFSRGEPRMGTLSWTISVHMTGAPAISASSVAAPLEGFDHVQVVVDPTPAPARKVIVQPSPADSVALLLVSSSRYGPGLTFTANDGKKDGSTVALTQPQVLAAGAVGLLGAAPNVLKFTNGLAEPVTVDVYVFRDATP